MKITVNLSYFKSSGKWYADGEFETDHMPLYQIWDEVRSMLRSGKRPGLVDGPCEFFVLVMVPEYEHAHPHLIRPEEARTRYEVLSTENEILKLVMTRVPQQTSMFYVRQECKDALAAIAALDSQGEDVHKKAATSKT